MKVPNKLLGASFLLLSAAPAFSVPAYPGLIPFRQDDGSTLSIRRVGDEYHNMVTSEDGYALLYNKETRNYEYALLADSKFVLSGIPAADAEARNTQDIEFLKGIDREAMERKFNSDWAIARSEAAAPRKAKAGASKIVRNNYNVPTTGDRDVLVILVDFADVKFSDCESTPDPVAYYDRFFHQDGFSENGCHGSAYEYYYKGSLGKYRPKFHVLGPIQVSGGYADYAGNGGSALTYTMIQEVIPLADQMYDIDFSIFDTDGDGLVDNVYCLYAGYGQADSTVINSIWPHSYNLKALDAEFEIDGVTISRYTVSQQINGLTHLPVGIGTFVHEFGHVLGLADHYNNSSPLGNPPNNVGTWDVMSQGSYNNDQNCPAPFSAFERYSLGWYEPEVIDPKDARQIPISPYMEDGKAYRVNVLPDDKEYFLIENRQQIDWDTYLPGHGVLVWHIEEDQKKWDENTPNTDQAHQMIDIVEAGTTLSSSGLDSDAFPGTKGVRSFNFTDWSDRSVFGFEWVEEDADGNCWFLLSDTGYKLPTPSLLMKDIMGTTATIEWKSDLPANIYEIQVLNEEKEILSHKASEPGELKLSDLEPETDYKVKISGSLNTLKSEVGEYRFSTLSRQIEEYAPEAYPAREIEPTSFLARWTEVPVATDYEVELYGVTHTAHGVLEHGFDNFSTSNPGLPEGWDITAKQGRLETEFGKELPSIRLRDNDARLLVSVPGEKIDSISFWFSPNKAGIILTVDKAVDGKWSEVWRYVTDRKREMTKTLNVCDADSVRLAISREEGITGGYLAIDDVTLYYMEDELSNIATFKVGPSYSDDFVKDGVCTFRITGLENSDKYGFRVRGLSGERVSLWSEIMRVEEGMNDPVSMIESISRNSADMNQAAIFNLQGIRIQAPADALPPGIYIINGKKVLIGKNH